MVSFGVGRGAAALCLDGRLRQVTLAQMGGNKLRIEAHRVHDSNGGNDAGETPDPGGYTVLAGRFTANAQVL